MLGIWATVDAPRDKVAVFLHSGDYDRMHQALSIAASAAAQGRPVQLFFFWWALERLVAGRLDEPDFVPPRDDVVERFETRGLPTLRELLRHVRDSGSCTLYACSGSLAAVDVDRGRLEAAVDQVVGWSTILALTAGVVDRFYL